MSSAKIGKQIEADLKDFLETLAVPKSDIKPMPLFSNDLRLMKSGKQSGLDLNWEISFNLSGNRYRWFFEAKGEGYKKYRRGSNCENFKISLISDKLLQLIGREGLNIDCWCLFAPYIRLDANDKSELENIGLHLPFKLIIWDRSTLSSYLPLHKKLYKKIYPKSKRFLKKMELLQIINQVKLDSVKGRFQSNIHKNYFILKDDLKQKCERTIIFCCETKKVNKQVVNKYYFEFQKAKYYIETNVLQEVDTDLEDVASGSNLSKEPKILNLVKALSESKSGTLTLADSIKSHLTDQSVPFLKITFLKKIKEFSNLDFVKINSSSYFGVVGDKDILFEKFEDYL